MLELALLVWVPFRVFLGIIVISEIIAPTLGAVKCYQLVQEFDDKKVAALLIKVVGIALTVIAVEMFCSLVAASGDKVLIPVQQRHNVWYFCWLLGGRLIRLAGLWILTLHLLLLKKQRR